MATVDLAKIWMRYMGDWSDNTQYEPMDYVHHQGRGYVSISENSGIEPGSNQSVWSLSANKGTSAGTIIDTKIIYSESDINVLNLEWDTIHVFPSPSSLTFSISSKPNDGIEHKIIIMLKTPADISEFSLAADPDIIWGEYPLPQYIAPSMTYILTVDSNSMVASSACVPSMRPIEARESYADTSVTNYPNLAWDTVHNLPELRSLSFSLAQSPDPAYNHQMVVAFSTPVDVNNFVLTVPAGLTWSDTDLTQNINASTRYTIIIDCDNMTASWREGYNKLDSIDVAAVPLGMNYKLQLLTTASAPLYSSSNTSVATVGSNGEILGVSLGDATITATDGRVSDDTLIHVGSEVIDTSSIPAQDRIIDEIEIINPVEQIEVGDEVALYAVGISNTLSPKYDVGYYNPIKFTSSDTSVAQIMFGTLMALGEGSCTITASDLNNGASKSFSLTVVAKQEPSATAQETYIPTIDSTGSSDVTLAIATALEYASANGYKKVSFPQGNYLMDGASRPNATSIPIPSNLIVDFNNSNIYFQESSLTTSGYTMFSIIDKENVWLRNVNIYGENYNRATLIRKESDRTLLIGGFSKNIHVENCSFNWSPGFNVGISFTMSNRTGFYPNTRTAGSVEAGGLDDLGNDIAASGTWRTAFRACTLQNGYWIVGMFQGYQRAYMRSRLYDIFFYDSQKQLIYKKRNCYVYQRYFFPTDIVPSFCRLVFFQDSEPTGYEKDFGGFVHICDNRNPKDIYFKDCTFTHAISTGLSPQGGEHVVVDSCLFIDNGYQDPYSQIDWEDGRQSAQGCIVKNCTFRRDTLGSTANCQVINGYCRNVTLHDNYFFKSRLRSLTESTMQRCFHNVFEDAAPDITGKMDSIFAGNLLNVKPTIKAPDVSGTHTISVDNKIIQ